MLATAPDANYLRNRRYYIIQAIKSRKSINQIKSFLSQNSFDENETTIINNIKKFCVIELDIDINNNGYLLKDELICLEIPNEARMFTQKVDGRYTENIKTGCLMNRQPVFCLRH